MNTLKEMGIQQWRLKSSFNTKVSPVAGSLNENFSAEEVATMIPEQTEVSEVEINSTTTALSPVPIAETEFGETAGLSAGSYPTGESDVSIDESATQSGFRGGNLGDTDWHGLQSIIDTKEHCPSCGPGNTFLGGGDPNADWMFVVDAPTSRDLQAQALFAGRAGQLFEAMLNALGLDRNKVYTTSVFKCAPTDDLSVTPQCDELVHRQIQLVDPKIVVTFGEFAAQAVIKSNTPLGSLRNTEQRCFRTQKSIVATYSPEQMLDDVSLKSKVWHDLKLCLKIVAG